MKRLLYLVRHAKAEEATAFQRDHDRELVPSGLMAAARMGHYLHERGITTDQLISSTAPRAKATATVVAEQLKLSPDVVRLDAQLYDSGAGGYLAVVNGLPDDCQSAMIFGHNPDISYFAEFLTHQDVGSMDKAAVAAIEFTDLRWSEVSGRTGQLAFYTSPKQVPQ